MPLSTAVPMHRQLLSCLSSFRFADKFFSVPAIVALLNAIATTAPRLSVWHQQVMCIHASKQAGARLLSIAGTFAFLQMLDCKCTLHLHQPKCTGGVPLLSNERFRDRDCREGVQEGLVQTCIFSTDWPTPFRHTTHLTVPVVCMFVCLCVGRWCPL